jgi:xylose isomerase
MDLFYAHIGGMDAFARGLKIAAAIRKDGRLAEFVKERYSSWDSGLGAKIESGKVTMQELEAYILKKGDAAANRSGRQEFLENLINEFV